MTNYIEFPLAVVSSWLTIPDWLLSSGVYAFPSAVYWSSEYGRDSRRRPCPIFSADSRNPRVHSALNLPSAAPLRYYYSYPIDPFPLHIIATWLGEKFYSLFQIIYLSNNLYWNSKFKNTYIVLIDSIKFWRMCLGN